MAVNTTLAGLSQTAANNGPDGSTDAPSTLDDSIRNALAFIAQLRDATHVYAGSISGTNTITGSISTSPTAYVTGLTYWFIAAGANTGAATLNLNSIGAKALTKNGTAALVGGEIASGQVVAATYDGTQFQLVNIAQPFNGSYSSVIASRAINTTYTNSTGKPMHVTASVQGTVNNSTVSISWTIGGVTGVCLGSQIAGATAGNTTLSASAIVPPGGAYRLAVTQGVLSSWLELT